MDAQVHVVKVTPLRGGPYYLIDRNGDRRTCVGLQLDSSSQRQEAHALRIDASHVGIALIRRARCGTAARALDAAFSPCSPHAA